MPTTNSVSYLFLVDFYYLTKLSGDEADCSESIIYFYPQKEPTKDQLLELGQIIGLSQCFAGLLSSHVNEFDYKKSIVTSVAYGRHSIFLVLNRDRFTTEESKLHLRRILNLFHFLFGNFNEMQKTFPEKKEVEQYLKQTLTPIVDFVFNLNRSITSLFSTIKYLPSTRLMRLLSLDGKHFLEHLQSKFDIHDGLIAYDNRILHSTFDNESTFSLQTIFKIIRKLPHEFIRHSAEKEVHVNNGVSLLRAFFVTSSSSTSIKTVSEPTSPNVLFPTANSSLLRPKPSDSIIIRDGNTTNQIYEPIASPFASENQQRSSSVFYADSPVLSSSEAGFDTDQHEGSNDSPPRLLNRQNAVSTSTENIRRRGISINMKKSEESNSPSPSLASFTMNSESDLSDSDQINSVAHPTRLNFLEVKTDEDGSDYDDVPFPCSSTSDNGFDGFRARSQTMTERTPLFQLKKQKFTEVSEYNNEPERDETVLYVQKNSRMIVVYRLKTKTPSDEYLKKLWLITMTKLPDLDGQIYMTCNFDEGEKQETHVKFQCIENTRALHFDRTWQNHRPYRPIVASETVALAFAARSKLSEEPKRQMIGFARGNHSLSADRRSKTRLTFNCQQQVRML